jgi:class 3 adenylate cyclase
MGKLRAERERAESLLLNMLPAEVAAELKKEGSASPKRFDSMSVLFADIVGFTPLSSVMSPEEVVDSLNTVFTHFDHLAEKHEVEKIRTIGDSYMAAAGVPVTRDDHAQVLAAMALDMLDYASESRFSFRIGINSGPVVAGVIGTHKFQYDIWGDTVNTAYRMESHGETGRIQISEATNNLIRYDFATIPRGSIQVKGKGIMDAWFIERALANSG